VALVCFASPQVRDLGNATTLSFVAMIASIVVAVMQLAIVATHPYTDGEPAQAMGNPEAGSTAGSVDMALGLTSCAWSYVPSILTVELAHAVGDPQELRKAIRFSVLLSGLVFIAVGLPVAAMWGTAVVDPVYISDPWPADSAAARVLNAFLCVANLISYCLDSVPFCRYVQRRLDPHFSDGWRLKDCARYAMLTSPSILFAIVAAVFVGQPGGLFTMLAWVTAVTVPALNLIFPAVCTLFLRANAESTTTANLGTPLSSAEAGAVVPTILASRPAEPQPRVVAWAVLVVGVLVLIICFYAAVGRTVIASVRGPEIIGCEGWGIYTDIPGGGFPGWNGLWSS